MANKFRKFRMEKLEERQMMAGDMTAYVEFDSIGYETLYINEKAGQAGRDNSVFIRQMSDHTIRVLGTPTANGSISLVNGKQYQDFTFKTVAPNLIVKLGGGNDTVNITEITSPWLNFVRMAVDVGAATASGNADQDSVSITNVLNGAGLSIITGADKDQVNVDHVTTNSLAIGADAGDDRVAIYNSTFYRQVSVQLGAGADDVKVMHVDVNSDVLDIQLGSENNTFLIDDVDVHNAHGIGTVAVIGGNQNDTGSILNVSTGLVWAPLSNGSDSLVLDHITAKEMRVEGGDGIDSLKMKNLAVDEVFQTGWETINGFPPLKDGLTTTPVKWASTTPTSTSPTPKLKLASIRR